MTFEVALAAQGQPQPVQRREITERLTDQQVRRAALGEAVAYFTYARRQDPSAPPVGVRTVLGIADHFAAYIQRGDHPAPETSQ